MRRAGLQGVTRRKFCRTTRRDERAQPVPDLLRRDFSATAPDRRWAADVTYVSTWSGFLFLAVVIDVFSRRIVGWSMSAHQRAELVTNALRMAVTRRGPTGVVVHHSDQGCQYTSYDFAQACRRAGVERSMGSVGDCYDNALARASSPPLECDLLDRTVFENRNAARVAIFEFIEGFYNLGGGTPRSETSRRLSSSGAGTPDPSHATLLEPRPDVSVKPESLQGLSGRECAEERSGVLRSDEHRPPRTGPR